MFYHLSQIVSRSKVTSFNRNRLFLALCSLAISTMAFYPANSEVLNDNFDSYGQGVLNRGYEWPGVIPGSDGLSWRAWHYGEQALVEGSELGRTGSIYRSSVNPGDENAYSFTRLSPAYLGVTWTISFDFYIDSLTADPAGSTVSLMRIYDTEGMDNGFNDNNSIASIHVQESEGVYKLEAGFGDTVGGSNRATLANVVSNQWYTVSISGNNAAQTLSFTLQGEEHGEIVIVDKFIARIPIR